jgi:hypothetical protein
VVTRIDAALEYEELVIRAFFDVEGVLNRTSFDVIREAAIRHGIEPTIC